MLPEISVDWLLERVRDNGDGCLIWTGFSQNGDPKATKGNNGVPYNVRRAIWKLMHGKDPAKNCCIVNKCRAENCVAPECLEQVPRGSLKAGKKMQANVRIKMAMARRQQSPLTQEALQEIKSRTETQRALGRKHGITQSMVSKIQTGKSWADFTSPWAGLGA